LTAWTIIRPPVYSATERIKGSDRFSRRKACTPLGAASQVVFQRWISATPSHALAVACGHLGECTHEQEPGRAVQAAAKAGTLDPERLNRWRKLQDENRAKTPALKGPRGNKRES
jgi:hypothetical protein